MCLNLLMARLTSDSVRQLLMVLNLTRSARATGGPVNQAYQDAVRQVSNHYAVRYQTIGDLRRRLGFHDVAQYMRQIERWLGGDGAPLMRTVEQHADLAAHTLVKEFFASGTLPELIPTQRKKESDVAPPRSMEQTGSIAGELRLALDPELARRIQLATLAKVGASLQETVTALINRGFDAEKDRIKEFLADL
jgi:hypothetical protein